MVPGWRAEAGRACEETGTGILMKIAERRPFASFRLEAVRWSQTASDQTWIQIPPHQMQLAALLFTSRNSGGEATSYSPLGQSATFS